MSKYNEISQQVSFKRRVKKGRKSSFGSQSQRAVENYGIDIKANTQRPSFIPFPFGLGTVVIEA